MKEEGNQRERASNAKQLAKGPIKLLQLQLLRDPL